MAKIGPKFEHDPVFPERTNTEFIQVINPKYLKMRVWERGAGATLACGTGACACLVVTSMLGKTLDKVNIYLPGGKLEIEWPNQAGPVLMQGPALKVFRGEIDI